MSEDHPAASSRCAVVFLGAEPTQKQTWRVRCSCGWTEKTGYVSHDPEVGITSGKAHDVLMYHWERHAYTQEELLMLHELEGCEICAWGGA